MRSSKIHPAVLCLRFLGVRAGHVGGRGHQRMYKKLDSWDLQLREDGGITQRLSGCSNSRADETQPRRLIRRG
jgi:hypothetical protein